MEAKRFDGSMAQYERSAIRDLELARLAELRPGADLLRRRRRHRRDGGAGGAGRPADASAISCCINTFLMQIYRPLNMIGFVYREIRQGLTDIEEMFKLLDQEPEILDRPDAQAARHRPAR